MLGLQHDQNYLVDYDPRWPLLFVQEAARVGAVLGDRPYQLEHYGSTAVPGLRAKPILDLLLGIRPLAAWSVIRPALEALGYDYAAHAGVPGHHIFGRGRNATERTHLLHVVALNGIEWHSALRFRNALRADVALRGEYLLAKEQAVAAAPAGRVAYNACKARFFAKLEAKQKPVGPASGKIST